MAQIAATFVADFSAFLAAVDKAEIKLKGFEDSAARVGSRLSRFANDFSGTKVIQDATLMAEAIEKIGGVSKLTEANLQRASAAAKEAVEQLQKLGKGNEIPKNMQALADATSDLGKSSLSAMVPFHNLIGAFATGQILADAFEKGLELVTDGIKELGSLALEGAGALDIEENFNRMRGSADAAAQTMGVLRTATHNTITDMDLMKTAAGTLATGVELTDENFRTLAEGSFALAQATGKDVKSAFDSLNDAMVTGRTRGVELLTGKIDLAAAEEAYAKKLGVTAEQLSEEEKAAAHAEAILAKLEERTKSLGEQSDGLDEQVAQLNVRWNNFLEDLGKGIASSAALSTALQQVGHWIDDAFGTDRKKLVEDIRDATDKFVLMLYDVGDAAIDGFGAAKKEVLDLEGTLRAVYQFLGTLYRLLEDTALLAAKTGHMLTGGQEAEIARIEENLKNNWNALRENEKAMNDIGARRQNVDTDVAAAHAALGKLRADTVAAIASASKGAEKILTGAGGGGGGTRPRKPSKEDEKAIKEREKAEAELLATHKKLLGLDTVGSFEKQAASMQKYGTAAGMTGAELDEFFNKADENIISLRTLAAQFPAEAPGFLARADKIEEFANSLGRLNHVIDKTTAPTIASLEKQFGKLNAQIEEPPKPAFDLGPDLATLTEAEIRKRTGYQIPAPEMAPPKFTWLQDFEDQVTEMVTYVGNQLRQMARDFEGLDSIAVGGVGGFLEGLGTSMSKAMSAHNNPFANIGQSLMSGLKGGLVGLAGAGLDLGMDLLGKGLSKLFKSESKQTNRDRDAWVQANFGSADALRKLAFEAGATDKEVRALFDSHKVDEFNAAAKNVVGIIDDFTKLTSARKDFIKQWGGEENLRALAKQAGLSEEAIAKLFDTKKIDDFQDAAEAANDALAQMQQEQEADAKRLEEAIKKYGFAFEDLGPMLQKQKLDEQAKELIEDWRVLVGAGVGVREVNAKMADAMNEYLRTARRFGVEVPAAMEPILAKMIEQGQLTDDAGNKITDLQGLGVTFALTMGQQFDRVVVKLQGVIDKLQEVGDSIRDIPSHKDVTVAVHYDSQGNASIDPDFTTVQVTPEGTFSAQKGTGGKYLDFGQGTNAVLHGRERVVTAAEGMAEATAFGDMVAAVQGLQTVLVRAVRENALLVRDGALMARA